MQIEERQRQRTPSVRPTVFDVINPELFILAHDDKRHLHPKSSKRPNPTDFYAAA